MNQIDEALEGLVQAIREGEEYQKYQAVRAKVHEQPQLEEKIHAFRKKNYEVQNLQKKRSCTTRRISWSAKGSNFAKTRL